MAREHGRFGRMEIAATSGATTLTVVPYITDWSIEFTSDKAEVTAIGDGNKVYLAGLPDAKGQLSGYFDVDSDQFLTAAKDGLAREFKLYYSTSTTTDYFTGTAFFDFSVTGSVNDAKKFSCSWAAAGNITKVTT